MKEFIDRHARVKSVQTILASTCLHKATAILPNESLVYIAAVATLGKFVIS